MLSKSNFLLSPFSLLFSAQVLAEKPMFELKEKDDVIIDRYLKIHSAFLKKVAGLVLKKNFGSSSMIFEVLDILSLNLLTINWIERQSIDLFLSLSTRNDG